VNRATAEDLPDDVPHAWHAHALSDDHGQPEPLALVSAARPRDLLRFIQRAGIVLGAAMTLIAFVAHARRWSNQPAFDEVRAVRQDLHVEMDSLRQDVRTELTSTRWDLYLLATALAARDSATRLQLLSQISPPRTSKEGVSR
jgi:hypothetical protein